MEPLFDIIARREVVKKITAAFRDWDKRSDQWMLSRPLKWRIGLLIVIACLMMPVAIVGAEMMLAAALVSYCLGFIFLPLNFCLIAGAKRNMRFKLFHSGVVLVYFFPVLAMFFDWERFLGHFGGAIYLFTITPMLHFSYLAFAWQRFEKNTARKAVKFAASMLIMTVACTVVWDDVVMENLYNDTDDNMFGFLTPGNWVNNWDGQHPVVQVDHVVHGVGDMSAPDTIKKGWTVADLWLVWFLFIAVAVAVSVGLAWLPWVPWRWKGNSD